MIRRPSLKTLSASLLALTTFAANASDAAPHWGYTGHHGATHWAEMDPAFETCAKGSRQSPIDISTTVKEALPALEFQYSSAAPTLVNNGHTVQVNVPAGSRLTVGDKSYELLQFHFHTPSEETLKGRHTAMVAHFVHKSTAGELGVVGVLIQPGVPNKAFEPVFTHLPRPGEKIIVEALEIKLADMLPSNLGYYAFEGSLTTPPCSEGVHWMVLKQPITLAPAQIKAFRRLFPANARPVQPLQGRVVRESL